jgi:cytochrome c biogenesis protein CcmG/thiol:disulfide interchange protein DsbE
MNRARLSRQARRRRARRDRLVWGAVGLAIAVAAIVAVVAGGSNDPEKTPGVEEQRAVQVSGALPSYAGPDAIDAAIGRRLPSLSGQSFDGTPVVIEPDGRPWVIVVGAHWCPHCQAELPRLAGYLHDNPAPAGVQVAAVLSDTSADRPNYPPSEWMNAIGWPTPMLADDEQSSAAQALGASGFPYFVVVGSDGLVVTRASGEIGTSAFASLLERARDG